jgi:multidrug efflux pump subunit AcrA (membrane-fusion protein)
MNVRYRLVAGTALGAIALISASPTIAKPRKHAIAHKRLADPRDAKIAKLEARVDALTARLDAEETERQSTAQQVQSAQAAAATAQAQAATAQTQATNALAQTQANQVQVAKVENQVPPLEKAIKTGWFANTTISGKSFFNVSNINQKSTDLLGVTTNNAQNGTQAELKRFYIGVDHKFSNVFSANITTDFRYNANGTTKDTLVYVKKAFLQAKLDPALAVRIGAADLPWVPFVEGIYGYRFVENTLIDRTKFGTSSDWGVHVLGTFGNNLVSYQVSAINGAGYKTLARQSDTIDLEGRVSVNPIKPITLAIGGYTGKLSKSAANLPGSATPHTASRFDALAAYTDKRIRAGIEYFAAKNWNTVTSAFSDTSDGWSAFGSFAFTPKILAFGRFDWVKPSRDLNPTMKDNYFNAGVDYKPLPPLDLALVYKRERANHGFLSTSNGTIGGALDGTYDEIGLFGQFSF